MRRREKRAVAAIDAHLSSVGDSLTARGLTAAVGVAIGATGCSLTVADERHVWGDGAGAWAHHQIIYDGRVQGTLGFVPATLGRLPNVVAELGAPVAGLRLAVEIDRLRRKADSAVRQLIDDRWQATVEMEQERRSLERDLHDGVQHHIVALRMALSLLERQSDGARQRLPALLARLDATERALVDTASGILPIALASDGLAAGLAAELAHHEDVTLDVASLLNSYSPAVEAAVYFTCLEAVNNAHKHAPGARITVTVHDGDGRVEFSVRDTGPGFRKPAITSGLHNLSTRITAVGGHVDVLPTTTGTTISGYVP